MIMPIDQKTCLSIFIPEFGFFPSVSFQFWHLRCVSFCPRNFVSLLIWFTYFEHQQPDNWKLFELVVLKQNIVLYYIRTVVLTYIWSLQTIETLFIIRQLDVFHVNHSPLFAYLYPKDWLGIAKRRLRGKKP